ncbi:MAG: CinA family nicotinamide mononucleotide deamidase-related protein [Thermodesulfobacteriota bacterium]|nr:CinA family nicotinamide mononucleotide deamidase-related protein [Thermodesulfobacteriota bacterium]
MRTEIISTGEELISGAISDTNASWLASELLEAGLRVSRITSTGDDIKALSGTFSEVSNRADLVLVTGGLGPTQDDLTAEAAAAAAEDHFEINPRALVSIETYFEKKGWHMNKINTKQAELPAESRCIINHAGTAPGFYMKINEALFFFMPGVPFEMKAMFHTSVLPEIKKRVNIEDRILRQTFTLFGMPEAEVGKRLKGFSRKFPGIRLGFRAAFPLIYVKLACRCKKSAVGREKEKMAMAGTWVESKLGSRIVSLQGLSMAQEVGRLLSLKNATLGVAESCTGGLIADMLTDTAGSSQYFLLSAVTYSNRAKIDILGVNHKTIEVYGAVHQETAREMAEGAKQISGADYAVSTSGIAGPGGGSAEKPVGTVCIGLAGPGFSRGKHYCFSFTERAMNKKIFAVTALGLLRRALV